MATMETSLSDIFYYFVKILFFIAIPIQAMLWPTASSISAVCIYGMVNIFMYFTMESGAAWKSILSPGIYMFKTETTKTNYTFTILMFFYFAFYFFNFIKHESHILPMTTMWLDPSIASNFTGQLDPLDVTSDISKNMRANQFEWWKSVQLNAPLVYGTIPTGKTSSIQCSSGHGFNCYAKVWSTPSPSSWAPTTTSFIPFADQFYDVDVAVTPGPGKRCQDLEVYRLAVDQNMNIIQALDYPASAIPALNSPNRLPVLTPPCNLYNTSSLCLQIAHTFTPQQYNQEVANLCSTYNQKLIFRLPTRIQDVDLDTNRAILDILLVSDSAASVQLSARWKIDSNNNYNGNDWFLFNSLWKQVVDTDQVQSWRESTNRADIFFKFLIAVLPAIFSWYVLSVEFLSFVSDNQILFLSIFIELPAILLFLSLGAWLPMAGSILCVLAVNYDINRKQRWQDFVRPVLFFVQAICNSIHFAWLLALVGQAGWNAFYYDVTLKQLYSMSYQFIITDQSSPTWIALMLPVILQINIAFLIGTIICVVMESTAKSILPSSQASTAASTFA